MSGDYPSKDRTILWLLIPVAIYCILSPLFVVWGGLVGDEGYYALSASFIRDGLKPYRDFFCPQMPAVFYAYAGWFSLVGPGIISGRILSAIFGFAAMLLISLACARRGGRGAGFVAGMLFACSPHVVFDISEIKTQSLSVFLSAYLLFVLSRREGKLHLADGALAMLLASAMFLTRLTFLPCLLFLWVFLAWELRHALPAVLGLIVANILVLAASFMWFEANGNMLFDVYFSHRDHFGAGPWSFPRFQLTLKNWIGNQLPIIAFFLGAMALFLCRVLREPRQVLKDRHLPFMLFLLASYWSYSVLHWQSVQNYATHQTVVVAFALVFSMQVVAPLIEAISRNHRAAGTAFFLLILVLPTPFGEWSLAFNGAGAPGRIEDALTVVRKYAGKNDSILTFNAEIPMQGGFKALQESGWGEFSYIPNMPDGQARRYTILNLAKLAEEIQSGRHRILCMGNREFAIMAGGDQKLAGQLKELIDQKYIQVGSVNNYGQFNQELFIFAAKY